MKGTLTVRRAAARAARRPAAPPRAHARPRPLRRAQVPMEKGGKQLVRAMNGPRTWTSLEADKQGSDLTLPGRALLLCRNVGLHMCAQTRTAAPHLRRLPSAPSLPRVPPCLFHPLCTHPPARYPPARSSAPPLPPRLCAAVLCAGTQTQCAAQRASRCPSTFSTRPSRCSPPATTSGARPRAATAAPDPCTLPRAPLQPRAAAESGPRRAPAADPTAPPALTPCALRRSYIVKPKMHAPAEVALVDSLFGQLEGLLGLPANCAKVGVMDEERRASANLPEMIRAAQHRLCFVNTGLCARAGPRRRRGRRPARGETAAARGSRVPPACCASPPSRAQPRPDGRRDPHVHGGGRGAAQGRPQGAVRLVPRVRGGQRGNCARGRAAGQGPDRQR